MNINFYCRLKNKLSIALLITFLVIITGACASSAHFTRSTVVPAAEGTVKIKKDKNNNYVIDISIIRLAGPERLSPPKSTYVAWIETKNNGIKNIGKLNSSSGLLSKTLKASLHTVTSFKPKRVLITAEENGAIQYPGSQVVLSTNTLK